MGKALVLVDEERKGRQCDQFSTHAFPIFISEGLPAFQGVGLMVC